MAKYTPNNLAAGYGSTTQLNDNFTDIATELNDKVLYRDNPSGEANTMQNELDMNSNKITNLPAPSAANDAARYQDVLDGISTTDAVLPAQTGNSHKVLSTDGTNWVLKELGDSSLNLFPVDRATLKAIPAAERVAGASAVLTGLAAAADGGEGQYVYLESGLGAAATVSNDVTIIRPDDVASDASAGRWVKLRQGVVNALDFGAPNDGSADATAALELALLALNVNGGGELHIPPGTYRLDTTLDIPESIMGTDGAFRVIGEGMGSTIFDINHVLGPGVHMNNRSILKGVRITNSSGNRSTQTGTAVGDRGILVDSSGGETANATNVVIEDVYIDSQPSDGILINEGDGCILKNVHIENCGLDTGIDGHYLRVRSNNSSADNRHMLVQNLVCVSDGDHAGEIIDIDGGGNMACDGLYENIRIELTDPDDAGHTYDGPLVIVDGDRNTIRNLHISCAANDYESAAAVGVEVNGNNNLIDRCYIDKVKVALDIDGNSNEIRDGYIDDSGAAITSSVGIEIDTSSTGNTVTGRPVVTSNVDTAATPTDYPMGTGWHRTVSPVTLSGSATTIATGLPSNVTRYRMNWYGAGSGSTGWDFRIQLGHGATPTWVTSGYDTTTVFVGGTTGGNDDDGGGDHTDGFHLSAGTMAATTALDGELELILNDGTNWFGKGDASFSNTFHYTSRGRSGTLPATLTALRINTDTATYSAGTVTLEYWGGLHTS